MAKIGITTSTFGVYSQAPIDKLRAAGYEVVLNPYERRLTEAEALDFLADKVGLVAGLEPLNRKVLQASSLKAISRCGSGMSNVDLDAAAELGIRVSRTPDGPVQSVAEGTLAGLLAGLRRMPEMNEALHAGKWHKVNGDLLHGKSVLIIGYGRIGRKVGQLLSVFDVELLVVDPLAEEAIPLADALPRADVICLHASGDDLILDADAFAAMKEGVFICSAARGGQVDEDALARALDTGKVAGGYLDAFSDEPYNGKLCNYPQLVLTPHAGSYTIGCRVSMEGDAVDNLLRDLEEATG